MRSAARWLTFFLCSPWPNIQDPPQQAMKEACVDAKCFLSADRLCFPEPCWAVHSLTGCFLAELGKTNILTTLNTGFVFSSCILDVSLSAHRGRIKPEWNKATKHITCSSFHCSWKCSNLVFRTYFNTTAELKYRLCDIFYHVQFSLALISLVSVFNTESFSLSWPYPRPSNENTRLSNVPYTDI